jgi:hypothetical protein
MAAVRGNGDLSVEWPGDLERSLNVSSGKATPEVSLGRLSDANWKANYSDFSGAVEKIAEWITTAA